MPIGRTTIGWTTPCALMESASSCERLLPHVDARLVLAALQQVERQFRQLFVAGERGAAEPGVTRGTQRRSALRAVTQKVRARPRPSVGFFWDHGLDHSASRTGGLRDGGCADSATASSPAGERLPRPAIGRARRRAQCSRRGGRGYVLATLALLRGGSFRRRARGTPARRAIPCRAAARACRTTAPRRAGHCAG